MFRNKRTGKTLSEEMNIAQVKFQVFVSHELPEKAEKVLMETVQGSFDQEKYNDGKSSKWDDRKASDKNPANRKLLVKSGDLRRSFETFRRGNDVGIGTDVVYAQVHNEGGKAGKGEGFNMTQRQFMMKPGEENKKVTKQLDQFTDKRLDQIFK